MSMRKPMTNPFTSPTEVRADPTAKVLSAVGEQIHRMSDKKSGVRRVNFVQLAATAAQRAQITRMAAALTYRTIFGLIPVIVIGLVVLGARASDQQVEQIVTRLLAFTGLSEIAIESSDPAADTAASPTTPPTTPPATDEPVPDPALKAAGTEPNAPDAAASLGESQKLDAWIKTLVRRVRGIPLETIGVVGLVLLIYAGISMIVEIEHCFNEIYQAPGGKSWARRITQYWALLTLGPLMLVGSFYVGDQVTGFVRDITRAEAVASIGPGTVQAAPGEAPIAPPVEPEKPSAFTAWLQGFGATLVGGVGFSITVIISCTLLLVLYLTVPNTRVNLGPALAGALLAAILWECLKWGFTIYVKHSVGLSQLYGSIALLPLFLLWIYATWIVVLLGLQLAYSLQIYREVRLTGLSVLGLGKEAELLGPREPEMVDPAVMLPLLVLVAERFRTGKSTDTPMLAEKFAIAEPVVLDLMERASRAQLVHRVAADDNGRAFVLSRPPDMILAGDVLRFADGVSSKDRPNRPALLDDLARARLMAVGERTLADYLPPLPPSPPA
jgi:membrane protein